MCATWCRSGECPYGRKCQFAHGKEELRTRTAPMEAPELSMAPPGPSSMGWPYNMNAVQQLPQPPQPTGWSMPPLPLGPPPPMHGGATSAAPILGSNVGAAQFIPPLPPGPRPPTTAHIMSSPPTHAGVHSNSLPASLSPPLPSVSVNGPLDCPGALIGGGSTVAARPLAYAPSADPPLPQPPPPMPSMPPMPPMSTPTKPLAAAPAPSALSPSDELALLAMDLHLKGSAFSDENTDFWSPIRSPLKCNATTGKVEAIGSGRPPALTHAKANAIAGGAESPSPYSVPDSPLEPGLSKREASFQTQMVRRAVSFIFNEDEATSTRHSPMLYARHLASPQARAATAA